MRRLLGFFFIFATICFGQTTPQTLPPATVGQPPVKRTIVTKPRVVTAPAPKPAELTVDQVIQLVKAELSDDLIIAKIKKNNKALDLSTDELLKLKAAKVSENIIMLLMDPTAQPKVAPPPPPPPAPRPEPTPVVEQAPPPKVTHEPEAKIIAQPSTPTVENPTNAEDFKRLLKQKYDQKTLTVMVPGLTAGEFKKAFAGIGQGEAGLVWHHYHESIPIPNRKASGPLKFFGKKSSDMEQLDPRTFADLAGGLNTSSIQRGETLKVSKYYCALDYIQLDMVVTKLSHMKDMDMQKASTETTTTIRGNDAQQTVRVGTFGIRFMFYFDKNTTVKNHDYQTIVNEINKYFLPKDEAVKVLSAEQNVEIEPGTSEADVVKKLGQPLKSLKAGNQKSLKYKDMTVILKDGKVVEVKLD
jgi:hypothetical protein